MILMQEEHRGPTTVLVPSSVDPVKCSSLGSRLVLRETGELEAPKTAETVASGPLISTAERDTEVAPFEGLSSNL